MKKILLTAINSKYFHTNPTLLYFQEMTKDFGGDYQVSIIDLTISYQSYDILAAVVDAQPDILALSVYIWNTNTVKELLADLPQVLPQIKIVLGGPEVSYNPEYWVEKYPNSDYIVTGGGEGAWLTLLKSNFEYPYKIINKENLSLDEVPFPYHKEMFTNSSNKANDAADYRNRIVYYESSRGCPFRCSFCLSSRQDIKVEYRDIEKVKQELQFFIDWRVELVKFVDRTFNASPGHSRAIWTYLIKNNIKTCFHFEINPYMLTDEDLEILRQAPSGWFQFEMGIQSTHLATLRETGRRPLIMTNIPSCNAAFPDIIKERINKLKHNINIHLDLVFGLPYEGYQEAQESFNKVYELKAQTFQPGMLKVLPGTEMQEKADQYEMVYQSQPPYRILKNKWIDFEELNKFYNIEHLVNNLYNSHKFARTLDYLERIYDSPFLMFDKLEGFWKREKINYWLKDWIKTAKILIAFTAAELDKQENFQAVKDCLRWDLCFNTGMNNYPLFLHDEETDHLLKVWYAFRKRLRRHSIEGFPNEIIKQRKAIIFKPVSLKFRKLYSMNEEDCWLNIRDDDGNNRYVTLSFPKLLEVIK